MPLSEKSLAILKAIAPGHTYEQILRVGDWTYQDIFHTLRKLWKAITKPPQRHILSRKSERSTPRLMTGEIASKRPAYVECSKVGKV